MKLFQLHMCAVSRIQEVFSADLLLLRDKFLCVFLGLLEMSSYFKFSFRRAVQLAAAPHMKITETIHYFQSKCYFLKSDPHPPPCFKLD